MLLELCDSAILAARCFPVYWYRRVGNTATGGPPSGWPWPISSFPIDFSIFPLIQNVPSEWPGDSRCCSSRSINWNAGGTSPSAPLLVTLSAQEDFAIVLAPLGIWIAPRQWKTGDPSKKWRLALFGAGVAIGSVLYLYVATQVLIPWFRHGADIDYVGYFPKFGKNLPEIAKNILTNPLLFDQLLTPVSAVYLLKVLLPVGFLLLFSPGRLAVGAPLLLTLLLNELPGAV